jgi:hypothetical protein
VTRIVIAPLAVPRWYPPGVDPDHWRRALAEDVVDILATLAEVETGVAVTAADRSLADAVVWPTMRVYEVSELTVPEVLAAAVRDGYQQAAMITVDAPDLPAMLIGKLLRPLGSRPVAVAPASGGTGDAGLLGLAARLPAPDWLPDVSLDDADPATLRRAAPHPGEVAVSQGWHRLAGPDDLARLDPALEGWEATRALLSL